MRNSDHLSYVFDDLGSPIDYAIITLGHLNISNNDFRPECPKFAMK